MKTGAERGPERKEKEKKGKVGYGLSTTVSAVRTSQFQPSPRAEARANPRCIDERLREQGYLAVNLEYIQYVIRSFCDSYLL